LANCRDLRRSSNRNNRCSALDEFARARDVRFATPSRRPPTMRDLRGSRANETRGPFDDALVIGRDAWGGPSRLCPLQERIATNGSVALPTVLLELASPDRRSKNADGRVDQPRCRLDSNVNRRLFIVRGARELPHNDEGFTCRKLAEGA
jgi:hypothetical protein